MGRQSLARHMPQDGRVLEQLLDEVDVSHNHAAAAVSLQAELVHGIAWDTVSYINSHEVAR